ncbi:MAG: HypC/HybG/HupF family hydrogenase formation chaperone [Candidatus Asgardarchaeia archaeon]|nr:HypC/HybG/HupF family hydrogenase formation chaperone [Candidatus Odinarchaeota archaeon]
MCLGIPGKIVKIKGKIAIVDFGGVEREAIIALLDDVKVGDYVIVHAGYAIEKLRPEEAEETLKLLREISAYFSEG